MKRIVCFVACVMVLTASVFAYDNSPPASAAMGYSAFITMDTSELGIISVQLPVNWLYGSLSWDGSQLRNVTTSTITGYYGPDTSTQSVRWSGFSGPQYRSDDSGYWAYEDLTVLDVVSTNVHLIEDWGDITANQTSVLSTIQIFLVGVIVFLLFMKKF